MTDENFHPMEKKVDSFPENAIVEAAGIIVRFVVVHSDSGCEHHRRNAVFRKDLDVSNLEKYPGEIFATVIVVADLQVQVENAVGPVNQISVIFAKCAVVHCQNVVRTVPVDGGSGASQLIQVHHHIDAFRPYGFARLGVLEHTVAQCLPEFLRPGHTVVLAVESNENDASGIGLADEFCHSEHLRQTDLGNHSGGICISTPIDLAVYGSDVVEMGSDNDVTAFLEFSGSPEKPMTLCPAAPFEVLKD